MNESEDLQISQCNSKLYDKAWALKNNLFSSLDPDIIQNNDLSDYDKDNVLDLNLVDKNAKFSFLEDNKSDDLIREMEFSFYDNLLKKFSEENKKVLNKKNKKKQNKKIKSENDENVSEGIEIKHTKKNSILLNNIETKSSNIKYEKPNIKGNYDKREVRFQIEEVPMISNAKNFSENKFKHPVTVSKNFTAKSEYDKSHNTLISSNIKRRQSSTRNNHDEVSVQKHQFKETSNSSMNLGHSIFKKEIPEYNSKKNSEGDVKKNEKTVRPCGSENKLNKVFTSDNPKMNKNPTKYSKMSSNSKNSKNSRNSKILQSNNQINRNIISNSQNLTLVAVNEETKKKSKISFSFLKCLPFCK